MTSEADLIDNMIQSGDFPQPDEVLDVDAAAARVAAWQQRLRERIDTRRVEEYIALRGREAAAEQKRHEDAEAAKRAVAASSRIADGASFLLDVPSTPVAIWGKGDDILWPRGEALMIAGPQGVGKTTLAGQLLAGSIGLLPEVLGLPMTPCTNRVLYLAMDRPQQAQRSLRRLFREADRRMLAEVLRFWSGPPPADLATSPETLLEMCRQHDADVVFVDSLKDAAVGLSKDETGAGYNRARQLALAEGVQVVELHHVKKSGGESGTPKNIDGIYGSVWLTSGTGSVVMLWGEPGDPLVEFLHLKQPMNVVGPWHIVHDAVTGLSTVNYDEAKDLVGVAARCGVTGLSASDAACVLFETERPAKGDLAKARRALETLERKGRLRGVEPTTRGRGAEKRWFATVRDELGQPY